MRLAADIGFWTWALSGKFKGSIGMKPKAEEIKLRNPFRRHERLLAACIFGLLFVACSRAQDGQEKIDVDDVSRTFAVHLPKGYDSQQHYPVVILLHGRNLDGEEMARLTHFNQLADKDGVIAVYPSAMHAEWNIGVRPEQPPMAMGPRGGGRRGGWGGYPGGGGGYPGGGGGYPGGGRRGGQTPDDTKKKPEPADDVAFLNQMLDQLALKYSIDPRRIYATGLGDR